MGLAGSGIRADELKLVIYCGASRDYPASCSVAAEIIRLCGLGDRTLGMDMMAGCLATLAALDFAHGWLAKHGGDRAAERWPQTVDFADPSAMGLWGYGDGAGALVVGLDVPQPPLLEFVGAEFRKAGANIGHVVEAHRRTVSDRPRSEMAESYRRDHADAFAGLTERFPLSRHL
ncbi:hypothetical protein [Actinomadura rugatobispora]|uniref:Uncharacterized protein n=1 Tax=Actinomadura rugatobispora TaxID=1994 RepID=A0ABW1AAG7_9ACTN|nr:hypothetical protein GCM10010200_081900 [Actinomadura rugatobispora]